jgi:hypothetical protein
VWFLCYNQHTNFLKSPPYNIFEAKTNNFIISEEREQTMKVYISNASIATVFVHPIITAYNTLTMNIEVSSIIQPEDFDNHPNIWPTGISW